MLRPTTCALSLLVACGGGSEPPASPAAAGRTRTNPQAETLALTLVESSTQEAVIDLSFGRKPELPGPRMMELHLTLAGLELIESTALEAATAAEKQVFVQLKEPGLLRTVVMATSNLNELQSGGLVRYRFKRLGGTERLDFVPADPIFAPPEANAGLTLGAPLVMGGP